MCSPRAAVRAESWLFDMIFTHVLGQKFNCAVKACKNASPLYIPDKNYRSLRKPCSADIHNISFVEINLGSPLLHPP